MNNRKALQKIFKNFFHFIFHIFYGRVKLLKDASDCKINKLKINKITIGNKAFNIEHSIYEVYDGRIFTDLVEHVAIIKDNFILPDISYQQVNSELKDVSFNRAINLGTNRIQKKIKGSVFSLVQGTSGNNYFHFLFDIVVKLRIYEEKYSLDKIDYFYVPSVENWQKNILSLFGIPEEKLIDSQKHRHIKATKVIAVDHPWYKKGYVQEEIKNLPDWIIFFLREKFLKYSKKINTSNKIFIDRSDSKFNHCKLVNNQEVIKYLTSKGFQSYKISELDFFEQIYLFNNADIIIGPHGAAFSNIIFSKAGLNLIELIPDNHLSIKCKKISELLNFNYQKIQLKYFNKNDSDSGDMQIEISQLENILTYKK
tara:strand:- start:1067 stop:2173 length:1107 start_codon:yes stop_codon:yes gene_type:complete